MSGKVGPGKRRLILEARAEGKSLADAAKAAGVSTRTAERMSTEPTFQAELAGLLAQMAADDRHAFMEHRRKALRLAEFGLARAVELLRNPAATPGQQLQATRLLLEHGRELFPREVELAVSSPELDQPGQESRTLADIFVMPEGADDAVVIDLGREVHRRLNADSHAGGEMTEGEQHAAMAQQRGMAMDGELAPPRTPGYAYPTEEETRRADMAEVERQRRLHAAALMNQERIQQAGGR